AGAATLAHIGQPLRVLAGRRHGIQPARPWSDVAPSEAGRRARAIACAGSAPRYPGLAPHSLARTGARTGGRLDNSQAAREAICAQGHEPHPRQIDCPPSLSWDAARASQPSHTKGYWNTGTWVFSMRAMIDARHAAASRRR